MYMIAAVVLIWLATSLVVGAAWAVATYRRSGAVTPRRAVRTAAPVPVSALPRQRAPRASSARGREHAGSR